MFLGLLEKLVGVVQGIRMRRRRSNLLARGMRIGRDVNLPASTWIDRDFCYLISIGDRSRLAEECLLLAHDAQMDEFLDAGRIGRIVINSDCSIGARTTVLPGVEIGPRTVVAPNSVVARSLPPDSYCGGNPARVISTIDEYVSQHRRAMQQLPTYDRPSYEELQKSPGGRETLRTRLIDGGYVSQ